MQLLVGWIIHFRLEI